MRRVRRRVENGRPVKLNVSWTEGGLSPEGVTVFMDSNGVILRRSFRAEIDLANDYDADVVLEAEECPPNLSNWLTWLRLTGPNGHRYIGSDRAPCY